MTRRISGGAIRRTLALALALALGLALAACAAHESESEGEDVADRDRDRDRPLPPETIAARFPGVRVAVAAHIRAGRRRAAIVWPAFAGDALVDDQVVAVAFDPGRQRWRPRGLPLPVSVPDGPDALHKLLGADDLVVERTCGLAREAIPEFVHQQIEAFRRAHASGDIDGAIRAYEALTRAFAFELVAYDDLVTQWLILATADAGLEIQFTAGDNGEWYAVEASAGDRRHEGAMPLVRCADGWVLGRPLGR